MNTFKKWLEKCEYQYGLEYSKERQYLECKFENCKVYMYGNVKGGYVHDDRGNITKCKNVKECIELVEFLVEGIC